MKKPAEILDAVGHDAAAKKLGVAVSRVRRVCHEDLIPASWYVGLCDLAGRELPHDRFAFAPRKRSEDREAP